MLLLSQAHIQLCRCLEWPSLPIAEAVPALDDAAAAAETSDASAAAAPSTGAEEPKITDPVVQEFTQLYDELNTKLKELGFFDDRPEYTVSNNSRTELGIEKRALLTMSRERVDIVYSLPADKLAHLASQELPYVDRKVWSLQACSWVPCFGGLLTADSCGAEAAAQAAAPLVVAVR